MNKTVMFIGAGKYQMPVMQKAKDMGLKIVAVDGDPGAEGFKCADISYAIDIKDRENILRVAQENEIDGVLGVVTDMALPAVAFVAQKLGLPGITPKVVQIVTNKYLMRKKLREKGMSMPEFDVAKNAKEAMMIAERIGTPLVLKPVDSAGSKGVKRIDNIEDIEEAFCKAVEFSFKRECIIEEFMDGEEIAVDGFIYNGKLEVLSISDKIRTDPPFLLDTTVIFRSEYPPEILAKACKMVETALFKGAGVDNSPIHVEVMMTKEGPKIVEMAARGAGFKVFTDILPLVTGVDTLEASIRLALGLDIDLTITQGKVAILDFFENTAGMLRGIKGVDSAKKISGIYELDIYKRPGDSVEPLTCGSARIGHIISFGDTLEEASGALRSAKQIIQFEIY